MAEGPLFVAEAESQPNITKLNRRDAFAQTTLLRAVRDGNERQVLASFEVGADVNFIYKNGKTALFYSTRDKSVASTLIKAGADINITDNQGKTALMYAVQYNNESLACALLEADADANITDNEGKTALIYCAQIGYNRRANSIYTFMFKNHDDHEEIDAAKKSIASKLIKAGADINITDSDGKTALMYALQNNNKSLACTLIEAGADVNIIDCDGKTALFYTAINGKKSMFSKLITTGADISVTDNQGKTVLMYAVENNRASVVPELLDAGADVNITDKEGKTALIHCAQDCINRRKYMDHCMSRYHDDHTKIDANENKIVAFMLMQAGGEVNVADNQGKTALIYSLQNNNESLACALIDAGADVKITDNEGKTSLIYAVQNNNESLASVLIKAGADISKADNQGRTPLISAVSNYYESLASALLDAGADVNITDNEGKTALMYAAENKNVIIACALINAGADVNITDNQGKTALFYGVAYEKVLHTLIEQGNALINKRDRYGRSVLFYAITRSLTSARYLLDNGSNLHIKDNCNVSILSFYIEHCMANNNAHSVASYLSEGLNFLQEKGIHRKTIFEALVNSVFCKILLSNMMLHGYYVMFCYDLLIDTLQLAKKYVTGKYFKKKKIITNSLKILKEHTTLHIKILELLELLYELGINPNYADSDGNTALHYATCLPFGGVSQDTVVMTICHKLGDLGMSVHAKNHKNETPLLYCLSKKGWINTSDERSKIKLLVEVCSFLLDHGSSVEDTSQSGESVFHLILKLFQQGLHLQDKARRKDVLSELLKLLQLFPSSKVISGVTVNKRDANLNSPLHLWASLDFWHWTTVKLNLIFEYDSSVVVNNALEKKLLGTIFKHLLACGAKLNDRNETDQTPLHLCRTWSAIKCLLDAGVNPDVKDASGSPPLLVASKEKIFLKCVDRFYPDVVQEPKAFWKTVFDNNLDPWTVINQGESVFSILIESEAFALAKALLELACEGNYSQTDTTVFLLLNAICKDKSTRAHWKSILVDLILKSRKNLIRLKANEDTPLHFCCRNIVRASEYKLLEDEGFSYLSDDTLVNEANISVHWTIMKQLLTYGADCNVLDASGQSCMNIAKKCPALKDFLMKPKDIDEFPFVIPWKSNSMRYKHTLTKVARGQECRPVGSIWHHQNNIQKGSFGLVFAGINEKDGREVAIKRTEKLRMHRPEDKREITNLAALADCEQVVRYLFFTEDEDFSYVVLELMEGNLNDYLGGSFDCGKSVLLCGNVVTGLKYLHEQDILHRDLKPSNILFRTFPKLCLKIADFGLSRHIDTRSTSATASGSIAGTRCWSAPEVLNSTSPKHSMASDVFSCGLVFHYILSVKRHPFLLADWANISELQIDETIANVKNNKTDGWDDSLCPEATDLVKCMLDSDKRKRPTAAEALTHPLFWSEKKKMDLVIAVGNQPEFECPHARRSSPLTAVETDLDTIFGIIVKYVTWDDPTYVHMPAIYTEMTQRRRSYDTRSVVELVRFIRNTHAHVSEDKRPTLIRKLVLEDFVFLDYFPNLVMEVFNCVKTHGWNTREELKYALD